MSWYHTSDGQYFKRAEDGSVLLFKDVSNSTESPAEDQKPDIVIEADGWASVVAGMSSYGDVSDAFQAARALHSGTLQFAAPPTIKGG